MAIDQRQPRSTRVTFVLERVYGRNGNGHAEGDAIDEREQRLVRALGWFSIGLGLAEMTAPRSVSKMIGVTGRPMLMRAMGLREFASGVGILATPRPAGWLWSRVGGDLMDLALLGTAATSRDANRRRAVAATAAVAGVAVMDVVFSQRLTRRALSEPVRVKKTIAVNRPPEDVYRRWRDFESWPRFMSRVESVRVTGPNRTHWNAKGPMGASMEWDAEILEDKPNELLTWRSVGGDVSHAGAVRLRPASGGRGTEVSLEITYTPPANLIGTAMVKLFGDDPAQQVQEDLRRFKREAEAGEIPTTEGQPSGPAPSRVLTGWGRGRS
jgi:uncharacterized membrane protein